MYLCMSGAGVLRQLHVRPCNRTKTEATCFSLSPKREDFVLQIRGQEIHQQDTPTYLGVKLDRKLIWYPHISTHTQQSSRGTAGVPTFKSPVSSSCSLDGNSSLLYEGGSTSQVPQATVELADYGSVVQPDSL